MEIKNKKFNIEDIEDRKLFQEYLFSVGCYWGSPNRDNAKSIQNLNKQFLFISSDLEILCSNDISDWEYTDHSFIQAEWREFIIKIEEFEVNENLFVIRKDDILTIAKKDDIVDIHIDIILKHKKIDKYVFEDSEDKVILTEEEFKTIKEKLK